MEKSLLKNSIYNAIYKGLNVLFPLITSMYVSRILLPDGVGRISSSKNFVTYFVLIAALGIPTYGTKKIAECREKPEELNKIFSELFLINATSTIICTIAYYSLVSIVEIYNKDLYLYYVVGIEIIFNIFNIDWLYRGVEEYKYIMVRSFAVKVICFALTVLLVRNKSDYLLYAFISVMGIVLNYILNITHLRGNIRFVRKNLHLNTHIKPVVILLASTIAIEIYTMSDITMLTWSCSSQFVGYYSNAIKGVKTIKELVVAICAVYLPRLSYYYAEGKKEKFSGLARNGLSILMFFSLPAAVGVSLLAKPVISILYGAEFEPAILTTRILAASIFTISISNYIGYQILVVIGKEKRMLFISIFGAVLNIILNAVLIPLYKHNGAAVASAFTEICLAIIYFVSVRQFNIIKYRICDIAKLVVPTSAMCVAIYLIQLLNLGDILNVGISVILGGIVYGIVAVVVKNENAINMVEEIRKRVHL